MDSPARIVDEHLVLCVNHLLRKQSKQPDGVCVGGEGSAYRPAMQHLNWHKLWAKSVASKVFRLAKNRQVSTNRNLSVFSTAIIKVSSLGKIAAELDEQNISHFYLKIQINRRVISKLLATEQ